MTALTRDDLLMAEVNKLYHPPDKEYLDFQKQAIIAMYKGKNILLADEMGLGKTIQCTGFMNLTRPKHVLIIVPNNLRFNWWNEIEEWMDPELRASYDMDFCTSVAFFEADFIIASFEAVTKWNGQLINSRPWDLVIIDEAHYIKNRSTKRAQAVYGLTEIDAKKIMLTGTPIPNYPPELFPLIHFLDPMQWPSAASFEREYWPGKRPYNMTKLQRLLREGQRVHVGPGDEKIEVDKSGERSFQCGHCTWSGDSEVNAHAHVVNNVGHRCTVNYTIWSKKTVEQKYETLPGLMIRRMKKDVLPQLPKKRRQIIELPAEGVLLELVNKENALWQKNAEAVAELEQALDALVDKESDFESLVESLKFTRQYFFEEISFIRHELAKAKVPYVCEHVENLLENKDKLVLFTHHRDVGEAIQKHFGDKSVLVYGGMQQSEIYAKKDRFWQDESCEMFIGSMKMTGVGLNLQVASNIVFAESDWVPGTLTQCEDRCHRIGQESSLLIQHLAAKDSMDSSMLKRIIQKQKTINKALNRD